MDINWSRVGLVLGAGVSLAGNLAFTYLDDAPPMGAVVGAVFWPVALFVSIEIMRQVRVDGPLGVVRWLGVAVVAGLAAYVSYGHLSALLLSYGYDTVAAHGGPLAVDGLLIVSTTVPRRRDTTPPAVVTPARDTTPAAPVVATVDTTPTLALVATPSDSDTATLRRDTVAATRPRRRSVVSQSVATPNDSDPVADVATPPTTWDKITATHLLTSGSTVAYVVKLTYGDSPTAGERKRVERLATDLNELSDGALSMKHGDDVATARRLATPTNDTTITEGDNDVRP